MLSVRLLERIRDVPRAAWDALLGPDASPFVEWTWLDALEEAGCVDTDPEHMETTWLARHFAVFDDERLVAAAPAYVRLGSDGEFVFDWAWADVAQRMGLRYYPKVVLAVPFTPVTGPRALVAPGQDRAQMVGVLATAALKWAKKIDASGVHVLFPSEEEAALWEPYGFIRRAGFQYHWFRDGAQTFEDYVRRFKSKRRNQLRREASQAERDGLRVEALDPARIDAADIAAMYRFYTSTVDKHFYGNRYLNRRFFDLVADRFRERLAWVFAKDAAGTRVAGAFNVSKGNRLYGRYWGADVERPFLHFDVCYYHGVRECIARGLDVFEPGAGGEHKRARGFVPTMTHSVHHVFDARLRSILEPHLRMERERVTQIVAAGVTERVTER